MKMTEAQRLKCLNVLADNDIRYYKRGFETVDKLIAKLVLNGNSIGVPYGSLHNDELIKVVYSECQHNLERFDVQEILNWVMKQPSNDWFRV
jgi:hypothetical protein